MYNLVWQSDMSARQALKRHGNWYSLGVVRDDRDETSPPPISPFGSGRCRIAHCEGGNLPSDTDFLPLLARRARHAAAQLGHEARENFGAAVAAVVHEKADQRADPVKISA
jgi:hypothetical protein